MHYELKAFLFMHVMKVGIEITRFFLQVYLQDYLQHIISVSAVDFAAILIT